MASAHTIANLVIKLSGDVADFTNKMSSATGTVDKVAKKMGDVGKAMSLKVTAPIVALGAGTAKMAADFESSMMTLKIAAGDAGLSMEELDSAAIAVGGDARLLGVSASGAAESMTGLYKAGLTTGEIFGDLEGYMAGTAELGGALRASIDMAAASELDMVQASDLAATSLATFGSHLESEAERAEFINAAMNNMVQAADASVASVSGLAAGLKNVGPVAASMGMSIEDTNNALAILSTRGIEGAEAGTALKSMITNLRRPTDDVVETLKELNVSLYDAQGNFVGMPSVIGQLEKAFSGLTQEQRDLAAQTIAGTYGINALNTLVGEGVDGWYAMADATEKAATIQEVAAGKASTLHGQMEALMGSLETLGITIGKNIIPHVTSLVQSLIPLVEKITKLPDPVLKAATGFAALAAAIGPVLVVASTLITSVGTITGFIGSLVGSIGGLSAAALSGEAALAAMGGGAAAAGVSFTALLGPIALVAAAVAGLYLLIKKAPWPDTIKQTREYENTLHDASGALNEMNGFVDESANAASKAALEQQRLEEDTRRAAAANQLSAGQMSDYAEMELHAAEAAERQAVAQGRAADAARYSAKAQAELSKAVEGTADATEASEAALNRLKVMMDGPVRQANEQYLDGKAAILEQMVEEEAKLDELYAQHGQVIGSQEDLTIAQAKAQQTAKKLSAAQEALASNTDPGKQLELEAAVAKAKQAMDGANKAVSAAGPHHANLQGQIDETKTKYGELQGQLEGLAEAHRTHLEDIAISMMEQQLAADGWTKQEVEAYQEMLAGMGRLDEGAAELLDTVGEMADGLSDGSMTAAEAQKMLEDAATETQDALVTEELAAKNAETSVRNLGGASQEAATTVREAGDAASTASGNIDGLASSAGEADGKMQGAYQSARNLKGAIDGIESKTVDITVRTHHVGDAGGGIPEEAWEQNSPQFKLQTWLEKLVNYADRNTVNITVGTSKADRDVDEWFSLNSPTFVFQAALEKLVSFAKSNAIKVIADLPTGKLEKFAEVIGMVGDALGSLTGFADALSTLGGLGTVTAGGTVGTFGEVAAVLDRLTDWVRLMQDKLVEIVGRIPNLKEKTRESIEATSELISLMDDLLGNLHSLSEILTDIGEAIVPSVFQAASIHDNTEDASANIMDALDSLSIWARILAGELETFATDYLANVNLAADGAIEAMGSSVDKMVTLMSGLVDLSELLLALQDAVVPSVFQSASIYDVTTGLKITDTLDSLARWADILYEQLADLAQNVFDVDAEAAPALDSMATLVDTVSKLMGALTDLAGALTEFGSLEDFEGALARFEGALDGIKSAMRSAYEKFEELLTGDDSLLSDWEDGASIMAEKMDVLSGALSSAFGPLGDAVGFLETLGSAENLQAGFDRLGDWLVNLRTTMRDAYTEFEKLFSEDGLVVEFTEEGVWLLGEQMDALASALSNVFGPLGEAVGFLETLGGAELADLEAGFDRLGDQVANLLTAVRTAYNEYTELLAGDEALDLVNWTDKTWALGDKMDALAKALGNVFGPLGDAVGFLEKLGSAELEDLVAGFSRLGENIGALLAAMRTAYNEYKELLSGEDPLDLVNWTDKTWELGDKMDALAKALGNVFGPLGDAVGFLTKLGGAELTDLTEGFGRLGAQIGALVTAMRTAYNRYTELLEGDDPLNLINWTEDSWELGDKMDDLAKALNNVFGPLGDAVAFLTKLGSAGLVDLTEGFNRLGSQIGALLTAMRTAYVQYKELIDGPDALSMTGWTEDTWALGDMMDDFAKALGNVFGPLGDAVGFLTSLGSTELEDLEKGFSRLDAQIGKLVSAMRAAYENYKLLLLGDDAVSLENWTEDSWELGDKLDDFAKALSNVFGPLADAVGFLATLGGVKLEDLYAAFDSLGTVLPKLKEAARQAYEMMSSLANEELTDWDEGASEFAAKTDAMSGTVTKAFGGLDAAIGAMSSLVGLMWDMATIAGTEHLEAADFAGLAWGVDMFMGVMAYALARLKAAVSGLDLEGLSDIGGRLSDVGSGLQAMADGMQSVVELTASTTASVDSVTGGIVQAQDVLLGALNTVALLLQSPPWAGVSWYDYGTGMMQTLVDGINAVLPDLEGVLQYIRDLMPSSPAKTGPLSKPIDWSFMSDGLSETMGYIRAQMSLPDLALGGAGAGGNRYYDMTFNYPPNTPLDLKRQMELVELTDRYKR